MHIMWYSKRFICAIVYVLFLILFDGLSFYSIHVPYFWQANCQSTVFESFEFINIELNK